MKQKIYLQCTITRYDGTKFTNPLKISEANLIAKIAADNASVIVVKMACSNQFYKQIFG